MNLLIFFAHFYQRSITFQWHLSTGWINSKNETKSFTHIFILMCACESKYEKCNQKIISTINYNTRKGMLFEKFQNRNEAEQKFIYYTNFVVPKIYFVQREILKSKQNKAPGYDIQEYKLRRNCGQTTFQNKFKKNVRSFNNIQILNETTRPLGILSFTLRIEMLIILKSRCYNHILEDLAKQNLRCKSIRENFSLLWLTDSSSNSKHLRNTNVRIETSTPIQSFRRGKCIKH